LDVDIVKKYVNYIICMFINTCTNKNIKKRLKSEKWYQNVLITKPRTNRKDTKIEYGM